MIDLTNASDRCINFLNSTTEYELQEYHEVGVSSEVIFAKRKKLQDDVVLKFYLSNTPDFDPQEEGVIQNELKHRNLLEIYDLKNIDAFTSLMVCPKISGGNVRSFSIENNLSFKEITRIVKDVCLGIAHLHNAGYVHRDIKPDNIFIRSDDRHVLVGDLGSAKKLPASGTATASRLTIMYSAPECLNGNQYLTQSDIYQIGIVLYELLGGFTYIGDYSRAPTALIKKLAKEKSELIQDKIISEWILQVIKSGKFLQLDSLPWYYKSFFQKIIKKATHLNVSKRFNHVSELCHELDNILSKKYDMRYENGELHIKFSDIEYKIEEAGSLKLYKRKVGGWRKASHTSKSREELLSKILTR